MKYFGIKSIAVALLAIGMVACEEDQPTPDNPQPTTTGDVKIEFDYIWGMGNNPFELGQTYVHPMSGDTLTFNTLRHYVSNIRLERTDGTYWTQEESYYLVDFSDAESRILTIEGVPAGEYKSVEITFGVDSTRNVSGAQVGALDPANGMFWNWNTGYIMIKAEGSSPNSPSGAFSYHLGGFSGANNAITTRGLDFPGGALVTVSPSATPTIHCMANPARLFHSYGSVSNGPMIHMPNAAAAQMAQDFNTWVKVDHIHR
jgi:hypothetical protein